MIKQQQSTQEKPVFGVDYATKKKRIQKAEKPVAKPVPEKLCAFQVLEATQGEKPWEKLMKSTQCKNEALENGWCQEHKHAQDGMDIGEKLGWQSIEVPMCAYFAEGSIHQFTLTIGPGKRDWLAYFERATGKGLATILSYLKKRVEGVQ